MHGKARDHVESGEIRESEKKKQRTKSERELLSCTRAEAASVRLPFPHPPSKLEEKKNEIVLGKSGPPPLLPAWSCSLRRMSHYFEDLCIRVSGYINIEASI